MINKIKQIEIFLFVLFLFSTSSCFASSQAQKSDLCFENLLTSKSILNIENWSVEEINFLLSDAGYKRAVEKLTRELKEDRLKFLQEFVEKNDTNISNLFVLFYVAFSKVDLEFSLPVSQTEGIEKTQNAVVSYLDKFDIKQNIDNSKNVEKIADIFMLAYKTTDSYRDNFKRVFKFTLENADLNNVEQDIYSAAKDTYLAPLFAKQSMPSNFEYKEVFIEVLYQLLFESFEILTGHPFQVS